MIPNTYYQLNNNVLFRYNEIVKIISLDLQLLEIETSHGVKLKTTYHEISPLSITPELMEKSGFTLFEVNKKQLHTEYMFEKYIATKFFYVRGIEYKNKTLWYISNLSIQYYHQLQNYLSLLDDKLELIEHPVVSEI